MRKKLTIYIFLIAAAAVVVSSAVGIWGFRQRELAAARQTLIALLALVDRRSEGVGAEDLLDDFSWAAPDKRLTILAPDGVVLGDTYAETDENHSDRPEVYQALSSGYGEDVRRSSTTGVDCLYVALTFSDGRIGRAAMSLASVDALALQASAGLLTASVVALALALLLSRRLARLTAKPVEEAQVAVRMVDETLQSARSEFTANVTHELKTPLTSIKGFTDMMASGLVQDPKDRQRFLTMISVEADRLTRLVDDILKVSELETTIPAGGERAKLLAEARAAGEILTPQADAAGVTIHISGIETAAAIPPDQFREVALNLMENAVKYNRQGGMVSATVSLVDSRAVFTVADTGIGIPPESQGRVFERFYRVDKGRSRAAGGTGLGLAIVKHIVALYGGSVKLASVVNSGTTIIVTLPLAED